MITSKPSTEEYRSNYDAIFRTGKEHPADDVSLAADESMERTDDDNDGEEG